MTHKTASIPLSIITALLINHPGNVHAQAADNTKINERDQMNNQVTADEQGQSKSDLEITQAIRKAIIAEKSLSMYGHNIKIITTDGMVTLKGPVSSINESNWIQNTASQIVGVSNVIDQMDIVSN